MQQKQKAVIYMMISVILFLVWEFAFTTFGRKNKQKKSRTLEI